MVFSLVRERIQGYTDFVCRICRFMNIPLFRSAGYESKFPLRKKSGTVNRRKAKMSAVVAYFITRERHENLFNRY